MPPEEKPDDDVFAPLHAQLTKLRAELTQRWGASPPDAAAVAIQITGSVLPLMIKQVELMGQLDLGVGDAIGGLEARVGDLETPTTQIEPEDAAKLKTLAEGTIWLADLVLGLGTQKPDVQKRLDDLKVLAAECLTIIDDAEMEGEDDEDGDEEEAEEP